MPHAYATSPSCLFGFRRVLFTVAPGIVNFTIAPSLVHVGDNFIAKCCARGSPKPRITINGKLTSPSFTQNNGVYEGCTSVSIPTLGIDAGTNITTRCQVTLTQTRHCTAGTSDGKDRVLERALNSCLIALADTSENVTNTIIGKWPTRSRFHWISPFLLQQSISSASSSLIGILCEVFNEFPYQWEGMGLCGKKAELWYPFWNHCSFTQTRLYFVQALLFIFEVSLNWTEVTARTLEKMREQGMTWSQAALCWRWENCDHVMLPSKIYKFKEEDISQHPCTIKKKKEGRHG